MTILSNNQPIKRICHWPFWGRCPSHYHILPNTYWGATGTADHLTLLRLLLLFFIYFSKNLRFFFWFFVMLNHKKKVGALIRGRALITQNTVIILWPLSNKLGSEQVSKRSAAESSEQCGLRSKQMSVQCKRTSKRMSKWPSTYVLILG